MKGKVAFVAGAAIGYVLGTRAGRDQFDRLKTTALSAFDHPVVKDRVTQAETVITDALREQGAQVTERVVDMVKDKFNTSTTTHTTTGTTDAPDTGSSNGPSSAWDTPRS